MQKFTCLIILLLSYVKLNETAKILGVFPFPSISHQVAFRPLMQELAKRGHEVIVVTPNPAFPKGETPANLTEIGVHDISYGLWQEALSTVTGKKEDVGTQIRVVLDVVNRIVEKQIQTEEFQQLLRKKTVFDLVFIEACVRPTIVLSHIFKAPLIKISSFGSYGDYKDVGAPTHFFLYPTTTRQRIYNLTLLEKISELYNKFIFDSKFSANEEAEHEMFRRNFGDDVPSLNELANNVDMLFLNVHPIFEGNIPVPPNVIHMWGVLQTPAKELPQDMKSYLDSSKNGVIYMSFGTNTIPSQLDPEKIQMFMRVFSRLPYDVLFKWDKDELPGLSKNIRIGKWFPQAGILRHPNVKLFITQAGLQSTDEAIDAGVPLIGVPILGDQWYNSEKYVYHKIGEKLDMEYLDEEQIMNAIETVIGDDSYRQNIVKLGILFNDLPLKPLERAVWWTEYVIRHRGARHLRSPAANISWTDYLELPLLFTILLALLVVIIVFITVTCYLLRLVSSSKGKLKIN